jgi:hypothetical protein
MSEKSLRMPFTIHPSEFSILDPHRTVGWLTSLDGRDANDKIGVPRQPDIPLRIRRPVLSGLPRHRDTGMGRDFSNGER